jgi:hypothetical protein
MSNEKRKSRPRYPVEFRRQVVESVASVEPQPSYHVSLALPRIASTNG